MTYNRYLAAAKKCATMQEAQQIIDQAANDDRITARQYFNIRYTAINSAYQESIKGKINHE